MHAHCICKSLRAAAPGIYLPLYTRAIKLFGAALVVQRPLFTGDMAKATRKAKLEGVSQFLLGPAKRQVMAAFVPESAKPAVFAIMEWDEGGTVINRKQFFRVSSCACVTINLTCEQ
jgi:uncharacterized protein with WD repeat